MFFFFPLRRFLTVWLVYVSLSLSRFAYTNSRSVHSIFLFFFFFICHIYRIFFSSMLHATLYSILLFCLFPTPKTWNVTHLNVFAYQIRQNDFACNIYLFIYLNMNTKEEKESKNKKKQPMDLFFLCSLCVYMCVLLELGASAKPCRHIRLNSLMSAVRGMNCGAIYACANTNSSTLAHTRRTYQLPRLMILAVAVLNQNK